MQKIYTKASQVLIWLGEDRTARAKAAFETALDISSMICTNGKVDIQDIQKMDDWYHQLVYNAGDDMTLMENYAPMDSPVWDTLRALFSHEWFTRVWIIQEVNANSRCLTYWGHETIDFTRITLTAGYLIRNPTFHGKIFGISNMFVWWAFQLGAGYIRGKGIWTGTVSFAAPFRCSDPRDRVYGVLGFFGPEEEVANWITVDYKQSWQRVYQAFVEATIRKMGNLDALLYCSPTADLPTWVPPYNELPMQRNPFQPKFRWNAGASKTTKYSIGEKNSLLLEGFVVDDIQCHEIIIGASLFNALPAQQIMWRKMLDLVYESVIETGKTERDQALQDMAMGVTFGDDAHNLTKATDPKRRVTQFLTYLEQEVQINMQTEYGSKFNLPKHRENDPRFGAAIWSAIQGSVTFFTSSKGYIGLCGTMTKAAVGDKICVLHGCQYPMILRPKGGCYTIVSYAFINRMMEGEIIEAWSSGDLDLKEETIKIQ
jgi:hypothetical protein